MNDKTGLMENHIKQRRQDNYSTVERLLANAIVITVVGSPAIVYFFAGFEPAIITALILIVIGVWRR